MGVILSWRGGGMAHGNRQCFWKVVRQETPFLVQNRELVSKNTGKTLLGVEGLVEFPLGLGGLFLWQGVENQIQSRMVR